MRSNQLFLPHEKLIDVIKVTHGRQWSTENDWMGSEDTCEENEHFGFIERRLETLIHCWILTSVTVQSVQSLTLHGPFSFGFCRAAMSDGKETRFKTLSSFYPVH